MLEKLTGILIDPFKLTVEDFELDYNDEYGYKKIQEAINCKTFSVTRLDQTEVMFIDDEGRLKTHQRGFYLHNISIANAVYGKFNSKIAKGDFNFLSNMGQSEDEVTRFYVGKALILSDGGTGETYDTQYSFEKIKDEFTIYKLYVTDNDLEVGNINYGISFVETNRAEGFSLHPHTTHIDAALV